MSIDGSGGTAVKSATLVAAPPWFGGACLLRPPFAAWPARCVTWRYCTRYSIPWYTYVFCVGAVLLCCSAIVWSSFFISPPPPMPLSDTEWGICKLILWVGCTQTFQNTYIRTGRGSRFLGLGKQFHTSYDFFYANTISINCIILIVLCMYLAYQVLRMKVIYYLLPASKIDSASFR